MISEGPSILRLARFVNGYPFKPDDLGDEGLPVVRIRHLLDDSVEPERAQIPERAVCIDDGDLVFSWSATLAVRRWQRGRALLNQHLFRVDPADGVDLRWLHYVLEVAIERLKPLMHGSAMTHITQDMLRRVCVEKPGLRAQRVMADYLDTEIARIDAVITKKMRLVAVSRERLAAIHSRAYLELDASPRMRLGTVSRIFSGTGFPPASQGKTYGEVPFFKVSDFSLPGNETWLRSCNNWVSPDECMSLGGRIAPPGAVLFPKVGAALLGNARRITTQPSLFDNNVMSVTPLRHSAEFMHFLLSQVDLGELANPGPVPSINEDTIAALRVPSVSPDEQNRILADLRTATGWTAQISGTLARQVALLREHRRVLIAAAVTGELEIPGVA